MSEMKTGQHPGVTSFWEVGVSELGSKVRNTIHWA